MVGVILAVFRKSRSAADPDLLAIDCWAAMKGEPETLRARLNRTIQPVRRASGVEY
jgi:hypothetical protein